MRPPEPAPGSELVVGTRSSRLARWQTEYVVARLRDVWPQLSCRVVELSTRGDRVVDRPLPEIGGKGLLTLSPFPSWGTAW